MKYSHKTKHCSKCQRETSHLIKSKENSLVKTCEVCKTEKETARQMSNAKTGLVLGLLGLIDFHR